MGEIMVEDLHFMPFIEIKLLNRSNDVLKDLNIYTERYI
jgi:hypothetical protein